MYALLKHRKANSVYNWSHAWNKTQRPIR